ncbi:PGF-CTERM sorting domain-containing protein [Haloferax sp. AS1]|nr:PGF-CTERM sorting domain-containing protein [Haloferax sp. AS1]
MVGSLGLGAAIAPVAADAHGGTLTRTVDESSLAPGESTTVTVAINASERGNFTVVEELSPGFASVEIVDADGADFSGVRDGNDELFATYGDRENVTLVYEVTAADNATATTHDLTGYGDFGLEDIRASTTGDEEISVSSDAGASVVRSVDEATLEPGEPATVWVDVERDAAANFTVVEEFTPAFGSVEIVDADGADFSGVRDANDELFATYGDRKAVTLVYEVTAADNATTSTVYEFDGFTDVNGSESLTGGTDEISVQPSDGDEAGAVRSVDDETLAPGESTTVRVEVNRDRAANFTLVEAFTPAFDSVAIVDADGADFSGVRDANDELFATYGDRETVSLVYEVTAADDADAGTAYQFDGFADVNGSEATTGGTDELNVQSGSDDDDNWDLTRSVDDETLDPGESAVVSVEITGDEATNFTVVEEFNPGFASVEIVDADGADFSGVRDANDELFATYGDRENVTLQYRVTAGEDVDEDASYRLNGFTQFDADGKEMSVDGVETLAVGSDDDAGGGGGGGGGGGDDDDDDRDDDDNDESDDDDTDDENSDTPESTDSPDDGDDDDTGDDSDDSNDGDDDSGDSDDSNDGDDDSGDSDDSNDGDDAGDDSDGSDGDSGGTPETTTDDNTPATTTTDTPVPGFGVSVALAALVIGSVLLARRRAT